MPILAWFYGITIRMYFFSADHNPPHIHAIYNDDAAAIAIKTGELLDGELPPKALAMVREWLGQNRREVLNIWDTQTFRELPPLK